MNYSNIAENENNDQGEFKKTVPTQLLKLACFSGLVRLNKLGKIDHHAMLRHRQLDNFDLNLIHFDFDKLI